MIGTAFAITGAYIVGRNVHRLNEIRRSETAKKILRKTKKAGSKAKAKVRSTFSSGK